MPRSCLTRSGFKKLPKSSFQRNFKVVHISSNCFTTEPQTTATNKLITVPILFLQSGHLAFAAVASTAWYNGVDPLETSDERVPKVNRDSRHFFANLNTSLYIHLLCTQFLKHFSMCTCSTGKAPLYSNASTRAT